VQKLKFALLQDFLMRKACHELVNLLWCHIQFLAHIQGKPLWVTLPSKNPVIEY